MTKKPKSKFIRLDPETYQRLNHLKAHYRAPSFSAVLSGLIEGTTPTEDAIYLNKDALKLLHALAAKKNTDLSGVVREAIEYDEGVIEELNEIIDFVKRNRAKEQ